MSRISIPIVVVAIALAFAAGALAQFPGGGQGAGRGGTGGMLGGRNAQRGEKAPDTPVSVMGQVEMQLDRLEEDLKITAAQQAAWDTFARKVIRLADDVARARFAARTQQQETPTTALQQFDRLADTARNRVTAVEEIADAGRTLYAALTPEQKALADRRLAQIALPLASGAPPAASPRADPSPPPGARLPSP